jgi:predicted ATP-grasp superfamily ATP-dependent carboligase
MGTFPDYPLIVKPARGAGCRGVSLARNRRELRLAVARAGVTGARAPVIVQEYVRGTAASVSLLCDGSRAMALTVNSQTIRKSEAFSYGGGCVPFDHPLAARAIEVAVRACEAVPGLRGWVGVDLVLTRSEAVVIEINPRLTTAYVGVRAALDGNVAGLALTACAGALPSLPRVRHVRFSVDGRIRPVRGATSTARRVAS